MAFSAIAGAAMASLGVAMMMKPAPVEHHAACFGVGTGVCFSGSTEWVAAAAAATKSLDVKMAMTGDAI
jgi:hypothetical protein